MFMITAINLEEDRPSAFSTWKGKTAQVPRRIHQQSRAGASSWTPSRLSLLLESQGCGCNLPTGRKLLSPVSLPTPLSGTERGEAGGFIIQRPGLGTSMPSLPTYLHLHPSRDFLRAIYFGIEKKERDRDIWRDRGRQRDSESWAEPAHSTLHCWGLSGRLSPLPTVGCGFCLCFFIFLSVQVLTVVRVGMCPVQANPDVGLHWPCHSAG